MAKSKKIEVNRQLISEGKVQILYSDGSFETIDSPKPEFGDREPNTGTGHSFTDEELIERGYYTKKELKALRAAGKGV